ncbi:receptor like protein 30-like [Durio zibethinus]|uniref:Receptor like protein 30-like n=1 Tax=Durio zibethinus TaxID=66656 RepID=A0A6P5WLV7_DURZI|nr:receptor like protein 30-like [Durio zibethinus]
MEVFELRWFRIRYFLILLLLFQFDCSLSFSFNSSSTPPRHCPPDESFALLQFKNILSVDCSSCPDCYYLDSIGSIYNSNMSYPKTSSWKAGTNCCLWDGVMCDTETGYVIGLDLSCSCLRGIIPSNTSLVLLRHLRKLNLAFNNFSSSPIASVFGQFTTLTHLNVSNSNFSGIIPSAMFSHLHKLVSS